MLLSQVPVRHLVFMVHGIGQRLEKANLVDDVGDFRHITAGLAERHLTSYQRNRQRVLFIPCQVCLQASHGFDFLPYDLVLFKHKTDILQEHGFKSWPSPSLLRLNRCQFPSTPFPLLPQPKSCTWSSSRVFGP